MAAECRRCRNSERMDATPDVTVIDEEFDRKMTFNFRRLVFLAPPPAFFGLEIAVQLATSYEGYEAHRIVYYKGQKACHMHIRYQNEDYAAKAINNFEKYPGLQAGRVSDLLKALYVFEHMDQPMPSMTLAILDIVGTVERTNPLSRDIVSALLQKFGSPRILSYERNYSKVDHVQVLFSSMAEAFGACIAYGYWCKFSEPESARFRYRIRMVCTEKELMVLKKCSSAFDPSKGIFGLDYFVGSDSERDSQSTLDSQSQPQPYPLSETATMGIRAEIPRAYNREFISSNRRPNRRSRGRISNYRGGRGRNFSRPEQVLPGHFSTLQGSEHIPPGMEFFHIPN